MSSSVAPVGDASIDLVFRHLLQLQREAMSSRTVRCGYNAYDWNTIAMSRLLRLERVDNPLTDFQLPATDRLQPGDHP